MQLFLTTLGFSLIPAVIIGIRHLIWVRNHKKEMRSNFRAFEARIEADNLRRKR